MTHDPALRHDGDTDGYRRLAEVGIDEPGIFVFDFDGVIGDRLEDDIYRLEVTDADRALIGQAARRFGIRCGEMDWRYQRHLVYQAAAAALEMPIEPGPALAFAREAAAVAPMFVLTARSGWFAVERLRRFLSDRRLFPVETFHVGRVEKDRQLALIARELPGNTIFYFEDSAAHLQAVSGAAIPGVVPVLVDDESDPRPAEFVRARFESVVRSALQPGRRPLLAAV